jgi:hypothetical protein
MWGFSIAIAVLIFIAGFTGISDAGLYVKETLEWQTESNGQDLLNVFFVIPVLLISAFFIKRGSKVALTVWAGTLIYLVYTFLIYCFSVHFNKLFLIYCAILGLSFYAILYFFYSQKYLHVAEKSDRPGLVRTIGVYFIILAIMCYLLWTSDVLSSIMHHTVPQSIAASGLYTNPVYVIDLSLFLPGLFLSGILLLTKKKPGFLLAPILLTFLVIMDATVAFLAWYMNEKGQNDNPSITYVMGGLAIITLLMMVWYCGHDFQMKIHHKELHTHM